MAQVDIKQFRDTANRLNDLSMKKVRAEADLSNAEAQLQSCLDEMKEKYQVSTIDELRALYLKLSDEVSAEISSVNSKIDSAMSRLEAFQEQLK